MPVILSCDQLNQFVFPRSLRMYQQMLLRGEEIMIAHGGGVFKLQAARAEDFRNTLYFIRLEDQTCWKTVSEETSSAYSLDLALTPCTDSGMPAKIDGVTVLRFGHPNFAHFLWNELDAVLRVPGISHLRFHPAFQDYDTIVPLADFRLLREVPQSQIDQVQSVYVGSQLVTGQARQCALRSLRHGGGSENKHRACSMDRAAPSFLLGVRGSVHRELVNEVEFYVHVISRLRSAYPGSLILLDGITLQRDYDSSDAISQQRMLLVDKRIDSIMSLAGGSDLASLSGLTFPEWLASVSGISFYVAHAGTMQHKIGWLLANIPGICLTHPGHASSVARWCREQCANHAWLEALPDEYVEIGDMHSYLPHILLLAVERNRNFKVLNPQAAAAWIVGRINEHVAL